MRVRPIDPRDLLTEILDPHYQINIWETPTSSTTYVAENADLPSVQQWIQNNIGGKTFSLWVRFCDGENNITAVRLQGVDLSDSRTQYPPWA